MIKICGKNLVKTTIYAKKRKIYHFYLDESLAKVEKKFIEYCQDQNIKVELVTKNFLSKMNLQLHQGFVLEIDNYEYQNIEECIDKSKKQCFILLDGLEDPHNLGAIMRTADACGIDAIILPKNNSVSLNSTVAKVSTGAIEYVNVIEVNNLNNCIDYLKKNGFWVVGTTMNAEKSYTELKCDTSLAIVIGSEGFGIKRLTLEKCDYNVKIPMIGHVNSLNASVSCAILMYEWLRKK